MVFFNKHFLFFRISFFMALSNKYFFGFCNSFFIKLFISEFVFVLNFDEFFGMK
ncbi:hypothetical protein BD408DRAFT_417162 [Parasitella parasitica]|nr:hypothetical protein BD408DRAFT_417162 [Parasitella parasitica]